MSLNKNITVIGSRKRHSKAAEEYIQAKFRYPQDDGTVITWDGWVPVIYRRTGVCIPEGEKEKLNEHLNHLYEQMNPENKQAWKQEQELFWQTEKPNANTTKAFFDALAQGGWKCVECDLPPNRNWARRVQDLKELGYTLATDTNRFCPTCQSNKTHLILLPIPRANSSGNGYETWSPSLRRRILRLLDQKDVYENIRTPHVLPDHKFPEIRWDANTKTENPDDMSDDAIRKKFQLLSNQRNQQKREACRKCYQEGKRGIIYGIPFYYQGTEIWDESIPKTGKGAERGCKGCPWYDIDEWRRELLKRLDK